MWIPIRAQDQEFQIFSLLFLVINVLVFGELHSGGYVRKNTWKRTSIFFIWVSRSKSALVKKHSVVILVWFSGRRFRRSIWHFLEDLCDEESHKSAFRSSESFPCLNLSFIIFASFSMVKVAIPQDLSVRVVWLNPVLFLPIVENHFTLYSFLMTS